MWTYYGFIGFARQQADFLLRGYVVISYTLSVLIEALPSPVTCAHVFARITTLQCLHILPDEEKHVTKARLYS